ncbi:CPBP family intramembrane glutamic endopeptidase [Lysinibacillus odysseyi]|uniref:CAAX protease n=1 Tax=Lysinibacillus odysseyi 34hs-1 = NBRC 100172 TaxID=1220589 RepID=A0A0A3IWW7_9BACI|nr:CPBP family intramembrane glutamic endopeptidase [Lysinibacillus odysseyi]KGR87383.1 CAAX protease [Lysinibacillus odysseyi 34hs-1 = NBRC 100172]
MDPTFTEKKKSLKTAFFILLTYIFVFQLSALLLRLPGAQDFVLGLIDAPIKEKGSILAGWWTFIFGILSLIIIALLVMRDKNFLNIYEGKKASTTEAIGWGIIGFFMVFVGQMIGAAIEMAIGIKGGSENTANLVEVAKMAPIMVIVIAVIGPILEEFVFRRVVFGSFIQTQGFWLSAIISSVVFAAIHFEFTHILLYTICGLVFAFLYWKTKRLLTSIVAHILLNSFVSFMNLNADKLQQIMDNMPK